MGSPITFDNKDDDSDKNAVKMIVTEDDGVRGHCHYVVREEDSSSNGDGTVNGDACFEIDTVSLTHKLQFDESDEVAVTAFTGHVVLRDFPHPGFLCGNFPFHETSHEIYCIKCYCFICGVPAPCSTLNGVSEHCHQR